MSELSNRIRDLCLSLNNIADEIQRMEDRIDYLERKQSQDDIMMKSIADVINKRYS